MRYVRKMSLFASWLELFLVSVSQVAKIRESEELQLVEFRTESLRVLEERYREFMRQRQVFYQPQSSTASSQSGQSEWAFEWAWEMEGPGAESGLPWALDLPAVNALATLRLDALSLDEKMETLAGLTRVFTRFSLGLAHLSDPAVEMWGAWGEARALTALWGSAKEAEKAAEAGTVLGTLYRRCLEDVTFGLAAVVPPHASLRPVPRPELPRT